MRLSLETSELAVGREQGEIGGRFGCHCAPGRRRKSLVRKVAEEGLEVEVVYRGKTYVLGFAGDSRGIFRAERE